jgi:hypothetical protein
MIVQCGTTTTLMHRLMGKYSPGIVVASFFVEGLVGGISGPRAASVPTCSPIEEANKAELFTHSRRLQEVQ